MHVFPHCVSAVAQKEVRKLNKDRIATHVYQSKTLQNNDNTLQGCIRNLRGSLSARACMLNELWRWHISLEALRLKSSAITVVKPCSLVKNVVLYFGNRTK